VTAAPTGPAGMPAPLFILGARSGQACSTSRPSTGWRRFPKLRRRVWFGEDSPDAWVYNDRRPLRVELFPVPNRNEAWRERLPPDARQRVETIQYE
jgi:hypothetical protein